MTMNIALKGSDITNGVDRKKADTLANRVARMARSRAVAAWNPSCRVSLEVFADHTYNDIYDVAFLKAITKQKVKKLNY
jgi:hypothetical protein